ncbi:hypothetical protein BT69DRAFT_1291464 [Atractiella rhizophila]|nr:hypothetical protein BT69DRAFT_1291464 [Atractiella rhizophila]
MLLMTVPLSCYVSIHRHRFHVPTVKQNVTPIKPSPNHSLTLEPPPAYAIGPEPKKQK